MWTGLADAFRFSRAWTSPPSAPDGSEVRIPVGVEDVVPGTLTGSDGSAAGGSALRGWIVLHGMTRLGRRHPELLRFVRALASTGARVLVPEIREWIELEFAPERAREIIRAAVRWLDADPATASGGVVLLGFSFGAPQALLVAAEPSVAERIRGVVGWGGYADIERAFRFSLTGEHEWDGAVYRQEPDPYARWVIGRNCIPLSPSFGDTDAVVAALHGLASAAGERRLRPDSPTPEAHAERLRAEMSPEERSLFDVFAPPGGGHPDRDAASALVAELVPLMRRALPSLEPLRLIEGLPVPVRLLHSRTDRLIPFTESLRLHRGLEPKVPDLSVRLTGLYGHSGRGVEGGLLSRTIENARFLGALRRVFELA